jgi:hypothetical protein
MYGGLPLVLQFLKYRFIIIVSHPGPVSIYAGYSHYMDILSLLLPPLEVKLTIPHPIYHFIEE